MSAAFHFRRVPEAGTGGEVGGAAEVGDELADAEAAGEAIVDVGLLIAAARMRVSVSWRGGGAVKMAERTRRSGPP